MFHAELLVDQAVLHLALVVSAALKLESEEISSNKSSILTRSNRSSRRVLEKSQIENDVKAKVTHSDEINVSLDSQRNFPFGETLIGHRAYVTCDLITAVAQCGPVLLRSSIQGSH